MRRFQIPCAALVAGLAVLLSGCSGETPTAPAPSSGPGAGGGTGSCTTLVSMSATTDNPFAGSGSIVRATVTKAGVPVPDGGSVQFTTDLGGSYFAENGLQTISKTTSGGVADVTVVSVNAGTAHVVAVFDCAKAQKDLQFVGIPDTGPFISSFSPATGSCAGGDLITILGGRFGTGTTIIVYFGGVPGSLVTATNTQITVKSPARTLKNPAVPEVVPLTVSVNGTQTQPVSFTYACIPVDQKIFASSLTPTAGTPAGGDTVTINGGHFGTNIATTQVTFCGRSAQIVAQQDNVITVTTPVHQLANSAVSETCDVVVTRDIGLVSQQSATLAQAFTYRGTGSGATCNTDPTFFISSLAPNSGPADGATVVTITGSGFGSNASLLRVDFGGIPATIVSVSNTTISVSSPRRTLVNPIIPETVDVTVTDLGSPTQRCARVVSGFVYTAAPLQPVIFSVSPTTGPNDSSTRVSIFGDNFQFPMQVFLTGGTCGAQKVEAQVSDIALKTIVFKTPIAVGGNVCLASQLADIVITNPVTGKTASCPACFKYYACPTITSIAPGFGPYTGGTTVVITGHNFDQPATVGGGGTAWTPVSVSSQEIIAVTPPLLVSGCADVPGAVLVNGTSLSCPNAVGPIFTYLVKSLSPFVTKISPSFVPEAGPFPYLVTVTGGNFIDPNMRFVLKMPAGGPLTIFPSSRTPTQMTFNAPAFVGPFATTACTLGGVTGVKNINTSVELDVVNGTTTCSDVEQLVYVPADTSCRLPPLAITTTTLPNGTIGTAYNSALGATGGAPPYTWALVSGALPTGLNLSAGGVISGTPTAAGAFTFTVKVTDSVGGTTTAVLTITVVNPPLLITTTTLPDGVNGSAYSFTLLATGGAPAYTWTLASGTLPTPAAPAFAISAGGVISGTPTGAGTFAFTVRVTDSAAPTANTATANLSIKIP
jgi:large repetitive protein